MLVHIFQSMFKLSTYDMICNFQMTSSIYPASVSSDPKDDTENSKHEQKKSGRSDNIDLESDNAMCTASDTSSSDEKSDDSSITVRPCLFLFIKVRTFCNITCLI